MENKLYNLYTFLFIMVLDNDIFKTSPDYYREKCANILGISGGKKEFVKYPERWDEYSKLWKVDHEDYELMNIINFLLYVYNSGRYILNPKSAINAYKNYIGGVNKIPTSEYIRKQAHAVIQEALDEAIKLIYSRESDVKYLLALERYEKLNILNSI